MRSKQEDLEAQKRGAKVSTPTTPDNLSPREVQMKEDAKKDEQRAQDALKREEAKANRIPYPNSRPESHPSYPSRDGRAPNDYDRYDRNHERTPNSYRNEAEREERERNAKIDDALKIRKGESYSNAAERLLTLAGKTDPNQPRNQRLSHINCGSLINDEKPMACMSDSSFKSTMQLEIIAT